MPTPIPSFVLLCTFAVDAAALKTAETHLARGRYAEAEEAFAELARSDPQDERVITGQIAAWTAQGQRDDADKRLDAALKAAPEASLLLALRAQLHWERGLLDDAGSAADAALKHNPDQPLARLIQAHVWTETGKLKEASEGYRWFVRYYNRAQPKDAATLLLVAEGRAGEAREELEALQPGTVAEVRRLSAQAAVESALDEYSSARESARAAQRSNPVALLPVVQEALLLEYRLNDPGEAERVWRRVLELAGSSEELSALAQRMRAQVHLSRLARRAESAP